MRTLLSSVLVVGLVIASAGACSPSAPTSLSISPSSIAINSGQQAVLTVSPGGPATCVANGGTLAQAGNTLTFTAPIASAFFEIRCERAGQTITAIVAVSGPVTLEYLHAVPAHATAPTQNLPIFWIFQTGITLALGCQAPTWLGGNHWRCEFSLVPPETRFVRVHDGPRNLIEPALSGFYCATIRYNGVAAVPQADTDTGCVARFR